MGRVGLGWVGLGWIGLGWVGVGWVGLGWIGLGWLGLGSVGLGWTLGSMIIVLNTTTEHGGSEAVSNPILMADII